MNKSDRINVFAASAHSLFIIGNWKWYDYQTKNYAVPSQDQIASTCWQLFYTCEVILTENPENTFTRASTGRITCVLVRGGYPEFTLDITPRG